MRGAGTGVPRRRAEEGMVTVEMALALASLLAVFALMLAGLGAVRAHASLCQGARDAARLAAVGDSVGAGAVPLPVGGSVSVTESGEWVEVTGSVSVSGLPVGPLTCSVRTLREPLARP